MTKPTVVLGASANPEKYAYKAIEFLQTIHQPIYPVGIRQGEVLGLNISLDFSSIEEPIHTITLYLGALNQSQWIEPILALNPKRVIFNPGTENPGFEELLVEKGIEVDLACTLVMIKSGQY